MTEKIKLSKAEYLAKLTAERVYVRRLVQPFEAKPNRLNLFAQPIYVPPPSPATRAGSNDHLQFKSRG